MRHWAEKYLLIDYKQMRCSEFVEFVLRDHFKREFSFPKPEGTVFKQSHQIKENVPLFCVKTDKPQTGDLVLMHGIRMMCHVGLYVDIKGTGHVLHTEAKLRTAALQNLKHLFHIGYTVEGFYTWR